MESLADVEFDGDDTRITVKQPRKECIAEFGGHCIKFEREISGELAHNIIRNLKGVKVKQFMMWLPISSARVEEHPGTQIIFNVGPFSTSMPVQELWEYKFWAPSFQHTKAGKTTGASVPLLEAPRRQILETQKSISQAILRSPRACLV
eukprot:TRINITY_DN60697_c0_g1_i1.p1 TRINITY_DN60697_c0_g1~~TRINITY_DN60697_c0_g1_i1.p1  ORF type:complete len:149 (+),score=3.02 TRINITY_DN60697_c0_g1_i1:334-780(+)